MQINLKTIRKNRKRLGSVIMTFAALALTTALTFVVHTAQAATVTLVVDGDGMARVITVIVRRQHHIRQSVRQLLLQAPVIQSRYVRVHTAKMS
jgi:hypothetical protein